MRTRPSVSPPFLLSGAFHSLFLLLLVFWMEKSGPGMRRLRSQFKRPRRTVFGFDWAEWTLISISVLRGIGYWRDATVRRLRKHSLHMLSTALSETCPGQPTSRFRPRLPWRFAP